MQSLPPDDRDRHLARVAKYTNNQSSGLRKHRFLKQLSELENGNLLRSMDDDTTPGGIFVKLAFLARKRKFRLPDQVKGMVTMLVDKWERMSDPRGKMKHGIRYPPSLIHLSILLQTGGSSQNYNIFQELCGMPVFRHVLYVFADKLISSALILRPGPFIDAENSRPRWEKDSIHLSSAWRTSKAPSV